MHKVYIFTGVIAAGKTYIASALDGDFHYINFDAYAHSDNIVPIDNMERTVKEIVAEIREVSECLNDLTPFAIDGWFSFFPEWWKINEKESSLDYLKEQLGEDCELIPIIVFRKPKEVIKAIKSDKTKYQYPEYEKQISEVYRFLMNHIWRWYNGESEEAITHS